MAAHAIGNAWLVDYASFHIADNNLLKGDVFFAVLWTFWFHACDEQKKNRTILITTLLASQLAIVLNQALKMAAPMRPRPYSVATPGVYFPFNLGINDASSFPSDHASLFFALATGFWFLVCLTAHRHCRMALRNPHRLPATGHHRPALSERFGRRSARRHRKRMSPQLNAHP